MVQNIIRFYCEQQLAQVTEHLRISSKVDRISNPKFKPPTNPNTKPQKHQLTQSNLTQTHSNLILTHDKYISGQHARSSSSESCYFRFIASRTLWGFSTLRRIYISRSSYCWAAVSRHCLGIVQNFMSRPRQVVMRVRSAGRQWVFPIQVDQNGRSISMQTQLQLAQVSEHYRKPQKIFQPQYNIQYQNPQPPTSNKSQHQTLLPSHRPHPTHKTQSHPIQPQIFNINQQQILSHKTPKMPQNSKTPINISQKQYKAPLVSIITMTVLQLLFYIMPLSMMYWLLMGSYIPLTLSILTSVIQITVVRRSQRYIAIMNKYFRINQYLNIVRIYQQPQNQEQVKTLYCYHPHSVYGFGILLNINHPNYQGEGLSRATTFISNLALIIPIFGLHLKLLGISGADQKNVKAVLKAGKTASIVPGGFQQATLTTPEQFRIYIRKRQGFLKYAMRYNYSIRQVLLLNQHKSFHTFHHLLKYRLLLNRIKLPGTLFFSKYGLILPPSSTIPTIIGRQLRYKKTYKQGEQPTNQQINQFHDQYIEELVKFYNKYKASNGGCEIVIY